MISEGYAGHDRAGSPRFAHERVENVSEKWHTADTRLFPFPFGGGAMSGGAKIIEGLKDAAEYVLALPVKVQKENNWQLAAEHLTYGAERETAWMFFARGFMMRALHGPLPEPPIGNPEGKKGHRWRTNRKLARDR